MNKSIAMLIVAAASLPMTSNASLAAALGQGGKQATLESAPTAKGEKSFFKNVELECGGPNCSGTFKGKAGRLTTITEIQCAVGSDGQAQGGQVSIEAVFLELLPIASRSTDGATEIAIVKTPTNFVVEGAKTAVISFFFFGTANLATCIVKGTSKPS
ncbi:hypothetical protein RUR49_18080 [Pseudoxanthobacter sp. M-2]|uniref:hypothetical protein n=1 Tax=Pseudoxanthobacter sp. M-2 TaxID=3078754 RepID=UPI0038FCF5CB